MAFETGDTETLARFTEILAISDYVQTPEFFSYEMGRVAYHQLKDENLAKKYFQMTWKHRKSDETFGFSQLDQTYLKLIGKPPKKY